MASQTIGQRIAEQRKRLGLSQEALGEKTGVSRQAISKWEADGTIPEIDKLIMLSKLFGVSVGWLLGVEEQPEKQSDELTETQLKMVEEIVKRYRCEPAPKQTHQMAKALVGTVCVTILAIVGLWAVRGENSSSPDLTWQISQLQNDYSTIRNQLSSLNDRLDTISQAAENQEKLLTNYGFELTKLEETARFTFYGIPKTHHENQTATLRVSRGTGEVYHEYICSWDGLNWTCDIQLTIENGYEFAFLLNEPGGTQYIQPLEGEHLANLKESTEIQCEITERIKVTRELGELRVESMGAEVHMPSLLIGTDDVYWTELAFILYVDGVETDRRSLLADGIKDPYKPYQSGFSFSSGGSLMEVPNLYEDMQIEIRFYGELSNGMSREVSAGTWIIQDGEPVEQNS